MTSNELHAFKAAHTGLGNTWQMVAAFDNPISQLPAGGIDTEALYKAVEAHAIAVQAFRGLVRQFADKGKLPPAEGPKDLRT